MKIQTISGIAEVTETQLAWLEENGHVARVPNAAQGYPVYNGLVLSLITLLKKMPENWQPAIPEPAPGPIPAPAPGPIPGSIPDPAPIPGPIEEDEIIQLLKSMDQSLKVIADFFYRPTVGQPDTR